MPDLSVMPRCRVGDVYQSTNHTHTHTHTYTHTGENTWAHTYVGTAKHCDHFDIDTYLVGALFVLTDGAIKIFTEMENFEGNSVAPNYINTHISR